MGALWVVTPDDITFKIGSGFKDFDRENPPAVGTTILFRYNGVTNSGIPRFARFIRIRDDLDI
jgi:DNA ligase-1